jgi:hypothetical protein
MQQSFPEDGTERHGFDEYPSCVTHDPLHDSLTRKFAQHDELHHRRLPNISAWHFFARSLPRNGFTTHWSAFSVFGAHLRLDDSSLLLTGITHHHPPLVRTKGRHHRTSLSSLSSSNPVPH